MDVILAADLKCGSIVHGKSGKRETYFPIKTPLSSTSDPYGFIREIQPENLYIADLDRISGNSDHDSMIPRLAGEVACLYLDRGCRGPDDLLRISGVEEIIGTETAGYTLDLFTEGYLSVDMKEGGVIPTGIDPITFLSQADDYSFSGCILLNISGVGTKSGLEPIFLSGCRNAYSGRLLWGGGVSNLADLDLLASEGYDGAIIATALHSGEIPVDIIRRGRYC